MPTFLAPAHCSSALVLLERRPSSEPIWRTGCLPLWNPVQIGIGMGIGAKIIAKILDDFDTDTDTDTDTDFAERELLVGDNPLLQMQPQTPELIGSTL